MVETIRSLVAEHGRLSVLVESLDNAGDLYTLGLTSFAAVDVMLALEEHFGIAFPDAMLKRRSFASIGAIAACVDQLLGPHLQPRLLPTSAVAA